ALTAGRTYLRRVDALLAGLLDAGARVVVSSDHGNLEDLGVKGHTRARVPFAGSGVNLGAPVNVVEAGRVLAGWFGLP
ncbi:metalloenzyme domain protein, partial [Deinococcus sp. 12RED42]|nr:metalloenzyme domain protein [Deinococcus sp. 12RED42]